MKRKLSVFYMLLLLLLILFFVPQSAIASQAVAILKDANGEVVLTKSGGKMEFIAFNGMQVQEGDSIRTGKTSSVKIDFGNDNHATLGEYGKVTLAELSDTIGDNEFTILSAYSGKEVTIKQESGGLWSKVKRVFGAGNSHKVETSTAIMGVRGTLFLTYMRNNEESVSVIDGTVGVEKARGTSYTGTNEPKVTPNLALTLSGQAPLESQSINYQELFEKVDAILATEIIVDAVEAAEERATQAEKELQELDQTKDKEQAKKALELAAKAELMAAVAEQAVSGANQSSKSTEVNKRLQQRQQTLQQLEQRTKSVKESTQQIRQQVELLAVQSGLMEAEIKQTTEATLREVERITVQNPTVPPTTTSPSSDGGGSTENVSVTGVSLNYQSITLLPEATLQLTATVSPTNATNKSVNWQSSNTNVATVSPTGLVTAKALGEATITVTTVEGSKTASVTIVVTEYTFPQGYHANYYEYWYWDEVGETGIIDLYFYNMIHTNNEFDLSKFLFGSDGRTLLGQYSKKEYSNYDYLYEKGSYVIHDHHVRVYLTDTDKEMIHSLFLNNQLSTISTLEGWFKVNGVNQPTISSIQFRDNRYGAHYYKDLTFSNEAVDYIRLGLSNRNRENIDFSKMQLVSSNGQIVELSNYEKVIGSTISDQQNKGTIYLKNNYYEIEIVLKDEHKDMFKDGIVKVKASPGWNPDIVTSGFEIPIYYYEEHFKLDYNFVNDSSIELSWDKSKLSRDYNFYSLYYNYYDHLQQEWIHNEIDIDNTICINNICKVVIENKPLHADYYFNVHGYSHDWYLHGQYYYGRAYGRVNVNSSERVIAQQFPDGVLANNIAVWLGKQVHETITKAEIENKLVETQGVLNLNGGQIQTMAGFEIFNGTNLIELNLNSNVLSTFDVSGLTSLKILDLSYNSLSELDVSALTNLTDLKLKNNNFNSFPIGILEIGPLHLLDITGNNIDLEVSQNNIIHSTLEDRIQGYYYHEFYANYLYFVTSDQLNNASTEDTIRLNFDNLNLTLSPEYLIFKLEEGTIGNIIEEVLFRHSDSSTTTADLVSFEGEAIYGRRISADIEQIEIILKPGVTVSFEYIRFYGHPDLG